MIVILFVIATVLFWVSLWQLDHILSLHIWKEKGKKIEVVTLPYIGDVHMEITQFYVSLFISFGLSYVLVVLSLLGV